MEGHHVGLRGEDLLDRAGRRHPVGRQPRELTGVPADLVRRVAVHADQLEVGLGGDALDHLGADVAGGDLENPDRFAHGRLFCGSFGARGGQFGGASARRRDRTACAHLRIAVKPAYSRTRQRRRVGISLVRPDVDVLAELSDDLLPNSVALTSARLGSSAEPGRAADPDREAHVAGPLVDRGDGRGRAVVDHPPALGDRQAEAAVDRLDPAADVLDLLPVVTFEGDREIDVRHRVVEVLAGEHRHDRRLVHVLEVGEVDPVLQDVLRVQLQALLEQSCWGW